MLLVPVGCVKLWEGRKGGRLAHFGTNYAWKLDIVQNLCEFNQFFLCDILGSKFANNPRLYTTENIKSVTVANAIKDILLRFDLSLQLYRGQT